MKTRITKQSIQKLSSELDIADEFDRLFNILVQEDDVEDVEKKISNNLDGDIKIEAGLEK